MLSSLLKANFGREVNLTGQMIVQASDAVLREVTDLSALQVILLIHMAHQQTMSLEQAGKDTATFGDELEGLLQALLDKRYIHLAEPGLKGAFTITQEGEKEQTRLRLVVEHCADEVLAGFSEQDQAQLTAYLKRIQANCSRLKARQQHP